MTSKEPKNMTLDELEKAMWDAARDEDYEKANFFKNLWHARKLDPNNERIMVVEEGEVVPNGKAPEVKEEPKEEGGQTQWIKDCMSNPKAKGSVDGFIDAITQLKASVPELPDGYKGSEELQCCETFLALDHAPDCKNANWEAKEIIYINELLSYYVWWGDVAKKLSFLWEKMQDIKGGDTGKQVVLDKAIALLRGPCQATETALSKVSKLVDVTWDGGFTTKELDSLMDLAIAINRSRGSSVEDALKTAIMIMRGGNSD